MKVQLIDGWQRAWRLASMWAACGLALLSLLQADVLPYVQPLIPPQWWPWVTAGFALAIALLRVIAQPGALQGTPPKEGPL